jgi:hypothetical protein
MEHYKAVCFNYVGTAQLVEEFDTLPQALSFFAEKIKTALYAKVEITRKYDGLLIAEGNRESIRLYA